MQQEIYFIRHCEPNYNNHNDKERELTAKGMADSLLLVKFFEKITIDGIYSSTFKRAYETVKPLADNKDLPIIEMAEFCERKIDDEWIDDFNVFSQKQWQDFNYRLAGGESLNQTQQRNLLGISKLLVNKQKTMVVGSHGTALATIIAHYQSNFGYNEFVQIKSLFPFVVKFIFNDNYCQSIIFYDIFNQQSRIIL